MLAVRRLLAKGVALGASDLHLDPTEEGLRIVARRDGVLETLETLPAELAPNVVGRLKALAGLLAYRTDVPQEGRIARGEIEAEVRVATFPTLLGERVALRFDVPEAGPGHIADLGLPDDVRDAFVAALDEPEGVVLMTGPSGSGKTTSLYAGLRHLVSADVPRSAITVEDPIERRIEGVTQTQVNTASGLTYACALRSLLRQDPDAILVGEVRDRETADMVLEAGLTGHLVLSTIHAGTGPQVLTRLLEMGMEPFVVSTAIRGVLAQRLVRRTSPDGTYEGRVLVCEWLEMTPGLRTALHQSGDASNLALAAAKDGHRTLADHADDLVEKGVTTKEEIRRVLGVR